MTLKEKENNDLIKFDYLYIGGLKMGIYKYLDVNVNFCFESPYMIN